ncbi:YidB family protein [Methylorubrum sp. POS3]|uniref:YidB family protein n=1 Tax=Methylorubrum sp. POS3 TaxID=2998492 RepID=UPI00372AC3DD
MSKGYPSMTALLGLLAVAGYQNRDKIAEWLGSQTKGAPHAPDLDRAPTTVPSAATVSDRPSSLDGLLGGLGSGGVGGLIAGGLSELVDHFTRGGHGETAKSWIDHGDNRAMDESQLERAIGSETLDHLTQQTGLSRAALLARLSRELPSAIDRYSPDGRLPV